LVEILHEIVGVKVVVLSSHPQKLVASENVHEVAKEVVYHMLNLLIPVIRLIFSGFSILSLHKDKRRSWHWVSVYLNRVEA